MSTDLIPFENLSSQLKSAIGERSPENVNELKQIAKEAWEKVPAEKCQKPIDGYQKRLKSGTFIIVHAIFFNFFFEITIAAKKYFD